MLLLQWNSVKLLTHIFAVFWLGEVDQVIIVHVLGVEQVTVFLLAEIFRVDPIGSEEFLVCHAKCLSNGLCDQLSLEIREDKGWVSKVGQLVAGQRMEKRTERGHGQQWPGAHACQKPISRNIFSYEDEHQGAAVHLCSHLALSSPWGIHKVFTTFSWRCSLSS